MLMLGSFCRVRLAASSVGEMSGSSGQDANEPPPKRLKLTNGHAVPPAETNGALDDSSASSDSSLDTSSESESDSSSSDSSDSDEGSGSEVSIHPSNLIISRVIKTAVRSSASTRSTGSRESPDKGSECTKEEEAEVREGGARSGEGGRWERMARSG